ncbi:MAG: hypothetical protein ACK5IR_00045, partial [Tropicimonas sp.]
MRIIGAASFTLIVLLTPLALPAQDEDGGGMIQRFLQRSLSGSGREVRINGFEGLLSGEARLAELTIADDEGVWLTLRNAVLDWNRAALLRGQLSVEELSAGELIVVRRPVAAPADDTIEAPKAEASGFSLPELPVEIRVGRLAIDRAELGEPVLGQAAVLALGGSVTLADGEGSVDIALDRQDRPGDHVALRGGFANETRVLSVDVGVDEGAGGLVSSLMKLPGAPSLDLTIAGEGPLSDFGADIALRTDDQDRITGNVRLTGTEDGSSQFAAEVGGDVTPLLPAEYHDFFGTDIRLITDGSRAVDGAFDLTRLALTARSLDLRGAARLSAEGVPTFFDVEATIADSGGAPVRLPVASPVSLGHAAITAKFDASQSDSYQIAGGIAGLDLKTTQIARIDLSGSGTIQDETPISVASDLSYRITGLALEDAALSAAVGSDLAGTLALTWQQGGALNLTDIGLTGGDYSLAAKGDARIQGRSVHLSGDAAVNAADLSRFAALSGQKLAGRAQAKLAGKGDLLGGTFDITLDAGGDGLSIGNATVDPLLAEPVTLSAAARRSTEGTTLERFDLNSRAVTANASGNIGSGASDFGFQAALSDIGLVLPGREGALALSGRAHEASPGDWRAEVDLDGPYELTGSFGGKVTPGDSDLTLALNLPDIAPLVPGHSGVIDLSGTARETGTGWQFALTGSGPYQAALDLDGSVGDGPHRIRLAAGLPDIAPLVPQLSGPVRAEGTASDAGDGLWRVDFDTSGPMEAVAAISGLVGGGKSSLDLDLSVPDLAPVVPQLAGPLSARGNASELGAGRWKLDFDLNGAQSTSAALAGTVGGGGTDLAVDLTVPDIRPFAAGFTGALNARATAAQQAGGPWALNIDATGPYRSTVSGGGTYGGGTSALALRAVLPDLGAIVPSLSGPVTLDGKANEAGAGLWDVTLDAGLPYNGKAQVQSTLGGAALA